MTDPDYGETWAYESIVGAVPGIDISTRLAVAIQVGVFQTAVLAFAVLRDGRLTRPEAAVLFALFVPVAFIPGISGRLYNQFYFANVMYDVTKKFRLGFEVAQLKTLYNGRNPGNCTRFELMARYGF